MIAGRLVSCLSPSVRAIQILQLLESICALHHANTPTSQSSYTSRLRHQGSLCYTRNQKLVVRALAERRSALLLFNGASGRVERAALLQQAATGAATKIRYHEQMLRVLLKCVSGSRAGSDTERADRKSQPSPHSKPLHLTLSVLPSAMRSTLQPWHHYRTQLLYVAFCRTAAEMSFRTIEPLEELVYHALDPTLRAPMRVIYMTVCDCYVIGICLLCDWYVIGM